MISYPVRPSEPHYSVVGGGVYRRGHLRAGERGRRRVHDSAALSAAVLAHEAVSQQGAADYAVLDHKCVVCTFNN